MSLDRHLDHWSADDLAHLFEVRPDLLSASDRGLAAVARKAATTMSLGRAMVRADVAMIVVAEALIVRSPATVPEIADLLGTDDFDGVLDAAERLRRAGIVTAESGLLRPIETLVDLLHRPLGLGPSFVELAKGLDDDRLADLARRASADGGRRSPTIRAVANRLADPAVVRSLLADAPPDAVTLIDELVARRSAAVPLPAGYPYREPDRDDPRAWLLDAGLLIPVTDGVAELPRELVMAGLADGLAPSAMVRAPDLGPVTGLGPDLVAGAASAAANRALDGAEDLLRRIDLGEVSVRKVGGIGPKELGRLSKLQGLPVEDVARLLELLELARLIAVTGGTLGPTDLAAGWWGLDRPRRWLILVRAWLAAERFLSRGLPATDDEDGDGAPGRTAGPVALGDVEPVAAADQARRLLLDAAATIPPGSAFEVDRLFTLAVWRGPNLWGTGTPPPELLARWTLAEAELLGLVAHRSPAPVIGPLLDDDEERLVRAAESALSEDQEMVVLQGDLTAVSFGPLSPAVARPLGEMTERSEADGGSPVHRFTERSIRSALDRGWTVETITSFLTEHALSGLPQPLQYLLGDVERRYGSVRVMPAQAVIITADEATSVEIASTRRAARIGLRLIAPTVLTAPLDPVSVVEELRAEGLFPVLEGSSVVIERSTARPADGSGPDSGVASTSTATAVPARSATDGPSGGFGAPADWTGPALPAGPFPDEIADAVTALMEERADTASSDPAVDRVPAGTAGQAGPSLLRGWNRSVLVDVATGDGIERHRGVLVGLGERVTLLTDDGLVELDPAAVVGVTDPEIG